MTLENKLHELFLKNKIFDTNFFKKSIIKTSPSAVLTTVSKALEAIIFPILNDQHDDLFFNMFLASFSSNNGGFFEHFNLIFKYPAFHLWQFFTDLMALKVASAIIHLIAVVLPVLSICLVLGIFSRLFASAVECISPSPSHDLNR